MRAKSIKDISNLLLRDQYDQKVKNNSQNAIIVLDEAKCKSVLDFTTDFSPLNGGKKSSLYSLHYAEVCYEQRGSHLRLPPWQHNGVCDTRPDLTGHGTEPHIFRIVNDVLTTAPAGR